MNDKVRQQLVKYNKSRGYGTDNSELIETLLELDTVHEEESKRHRWWTEYFCVVDIDGMLVGLYRAKTTGDMSAQEAGWEFDEDSVCEVLPKEKTVITYERI